MEYKIELTRDEIELIDICCRDMLQLHTHNVKPKKFLNDKGEEQLRKLSNKMFSLSMSTN